MLNPVSPSPIGEMPILELRDVGKSFAGIFACRNISMAVRAGEVVAIAGENGAGKSTTMRCLSGFMTPSEGEILVDGSRVQFGSTRDGEAHGVAMIPQELDLFPELSIAENLFVSGARPRRRWGGFDWALMNRRAAAILAELGVSIDVTQPTKSLSSANAKLVQIARALGRNARVIIMDEPTAALSDREVTNLLGVIRYLRDRGTAVIYITHRLNEIFEISDRVLVLRDGKLVASGPTVEFSPQSLIQSMVGRSLEQLYVRHPHEPGEIALEVCGLGLPGKFRDISFCVRSGEILGLAGLIGAGRSEVAQAIYGMYPAKIGKILVGGKEVKISSVADAIALGLAYLPEERRSQGLILSDPIAQNISFAVLKRFVRFGLIQRRDERQFARNAAQTFTVRGASVEAPVGNLSGGNQQKVLLAKVMALEPKIIILDEPTRGVDVGAKAEIYGLIDELVRSGKAVILISSEMNEIISLSDRVYVMHEGEGSRLIEHGQISAEAIGAAAAGHPEASHVV